MVLSSREREIRQASVGITAAVRWQPANARGGRGAREAGQRGGKQSRAQGEDDAWKGEK
jgi:hypothetical protein